MVDKIFELKNSEGEVIERVSGPIIFKSDFGFLGVKGLKRAEKDALYRGKLHLICSNEGEFHIVNILELEDYLKGVVPNEMNCKFWLRSIKSPSSSRQKLCSIA